MKPFVVPVILLLTCQADAEEFKSSPFTVDESYVSRHDIVYLAPTQLEAEGLPLGNGDMGGLIWTHDNGVELQIHKNDVWSGPEDGGGAPGAMAVPRHCARVKVDFGLPVFGWIHHLNDFEGRLVMRKGEAWYSAKSGLAKTVVGSWLAQDRNVWVLECSTVFSPRFVSGGDAVANVVLERVGSRAFGGWYAGGFSRNPESGAGNTTTLVQGRDILLEENGDNMHFVVACRILGATGTQARRNNHRIETSTDHADFKVLISVATKDDSPEPRQAAVALLDQAERETVASLKSAKDEWYRRFWAKSFVKLGDDYLENIYYLRRYLMGAGSRGKYPVIFNGGLWRWNRDVTNWITPHHWNTQQQYWGLCVQNDCDLMRPYLETYARMARQPGMARLAARRGAPKDAILLAEMHQFDGTMVDPDRGDMRYNFTPAAQAASRFWEYYEFSGDKALLESEGYPFMKKAANFYLQKLEWNAEKKQFFLRGSVYEDGGGKGPALNPQSDRNCIEALFKSCIQAATVLRVDAGLIPKWQHVLDHLWPRRLTTENDIEGDVIAASDEPGKYSVKAWGIGGAAAFPADLVGIDQKDSPFGKAILNYIRGLKGYMYSHHPTPVIAARMGDGDEALKLLKDGIAEMQYFPSGLMFNCRGYPSDLYDLDLQVNLIGGPGRPTIKWRDFFQCGMETISICGTAMNEMMLQSHEGKIRVFPAIPAEWGNAPLAFKLLARGGFLVVAERGEGEVVHVGVKSQRGGVCRLQNPWPGREVAVSLAGKPVATGKSDGDILSFATEPNQEFVIRAAGSPPIAPPTRFASTPNNAPKTLGEKRMLGIEKGFKE